MNDLERTTKAFIEYSRVTADNVWVTAQTADLLVAMTGGGAIVPDGRLSLIGSANIHLLDSTTLAYLGTDTHVRATGDVVVDAYGDTNVISGAGAVSVSGVVGIGAAADVTDVDAKVHSYIADGVTVTKPSNSLDGLGDVKVTARHEFDSVSVAASLAVGKRGMGLAGSGACAGLNNRCPGLYWRRCRGDQRRKRDGGR